MNRILVLGGGIAGMSTVRALRFAPVNLTLVDSKNFQEFARGQRNLLTIRGEAVFVDARAKRVILREQSIAYDYLVVCSGLVNEYPRPGFTEANSGGPVTVIGGGKRGVEAAWKAGEGTTLIEQGPRILPDFSERIAGLVMERLAGKGIQVHCERLAIGMDGDVVRVSGPKGRESIVTRSAVWAGERKAAGIGRALAREVGARTDDKGRIFVSANLSVFGHPEIFGIGDLCASPHKGLATSASQQGRHVAEVIRARLAGYAVPPFEYVDQGRFVKLGGWAAGVINETEVVGLPAWLLQMAGTASSTWNARFRPVMTTSPRNLFSPFSRRSSGRSSG